MAIVCPNCGFLNEELDISSRCTQCGHKLSVPNHDQSSSAADHSKNPSAGAPRYPSFKPIAQRAPRRLTTLTSKPIQDEGRLKDRQSVAEYPHRRIERPATPAGPQRTESSARTLATDFVEGTITRKIDLEGEPPDPDPIRIIASLILAVDLFILFGSVVIALLVVFVIIAILSAVLNMMWLTTILGFVFQSIFSFLGPLLGLFGRSGRDRRLQPVTNYTLRTFGGQDITFRIKGQLVGAIPMENDRVRVRGRFRHGILRFREGVNLNNGEPYRLPTNWSVLWLIMLIIANIAGYLYFYAQSA